MKFRLFFLVSIIFAFSSWHVHSLQHSTWIPTDENHQAGTCTGPRSCGKIDPVNSPDYNMINVIKQSILLEEHLAEDNKYCIPCIIKHFLHIIGLCEEAIWLAGEDIDTYPYLQKSPGFYQKEFDRWLSQKNDEKTKRSVFSEIRSRRRQLINAYFLSAGEESETPVEASPVGMQSK